MSKTHLGHYIGPAPTDAELSIGTTQRNKNEASLELAHMCAANPKLLGLLCTSCNHPVSSHTPGDDWPCVEISSWTNDKCKCTRGTIKTDDIADEMQREP